MQPTMRDAVRRVLATAGITGAALTLSAAAALPALACHGKDDGGNTAPRQHPQSQPAHQQAKQESHDSSARSDSTGSHRAKPQSSHGKDSSSRHSASSRTPASDDSGRSQADGHNPPGNNGTVFIHQSAGDSHPHNQPHVTCGFYVALFGFDAGQPLSVSFTGQAPTGKGTPLPVTDGTATSTTSPDAAGGAGHDYDGDLGPFTVSNLDLANALGAPAKQGWHISLTVETGQGNGKHKVFWLAPCPGGAVAGGRTEAAGPAAAPGGTTGGTTGGSTAGGATVLGEQTAAGAPAAAAGTPDTLTSGTATGGAEVLGERVTRTAPAASQSAGGRSAGGVQVLGSRVTRAASAASLPFTGADVALMTIGAAGAIAAGGALSVAGRRRRRAALPR